MKNWRIAKKTVVFVVFVVAEMRDSSVDKKEGVNLREKVIEQYFVSEVKKLGGLALKVNSTSMRGLPDRMVLLPHGILFFVELKATGKGARVLQKFVHKKLQGLGFSVYIIDSKEQVKEVLQSYEVSAARIPKNSYQKAT